MYLDLKFAFRQLTKSPGFTVVALVTLALGIGLNTSMFSLMNQLVLQPLPYPAKDHLIRVYRTTPQSQNAGHSAPDYLDLARGSKDFADFAAFRMWGLTLAQADQSPVNLNALRVSAGFFGILGIQPELGRSFTPDEDALGSHVVMLSHATWQAQFGGDPTVIGRTVRVDGEPTTIIGVMPAEFSSVFLWGPGDAFRPLALTEAEKTDFKTSPLSIVGRFKPTETFNQVNSRLKVLAEQLALHRPNKDSHDGLRAVSLQSVIQTRNTIQISLLLLGVAGFVLLIACANLANLQLARAIARMREYSIRSALGASRRNLLGPLLAESLLLAMAGGCLGILVAIWSNAWMSNRLSENGLVMFRISLDWRVVSFALVISVLTGLVFGIIPAWLMSHVNLNDTLKTGARGSTGNRTQHRVRHVLIVTQFALALVLLAGAGFFIRGVDRMLTRDLGWDSGHLLQGGINLPPGKYSSPAQTYRFYTLLEDRLRTLPGVEQVSVSWALPIFQFSAARNYVVDGHATPPAGHEPLAFVNGITPSYLETLKIKLITGRNISLTDVLGSPAVALINESMAQALFPHENPLGRRIGGLDPANRGWMEVVGVISDQDTAVGFNAPATRFQVMRPLAQEAGNHVTIAMRAQSPGSLAEPLRRTIAELDADMAVQQLGTADELITKALSSTTMIDTLLVTFALLGLFLAAIGLYGVIARLVAQRTQEIGVRIALGAQSGDVIWLILGTGIRLALLGTGFGLVGVYGIARVIGAIAPELASQDYRSVIIAILALVAVALLACWLPARRATKVDPIAALRTE